MVKWATTHNRSIITSQWQTPPFSGSVDGEGEAVDIPPVPVMEPILPPVLDTEPTLPPVLAIGPCISPFPAMELTTHDYAMAWLAYQDAVDLLSVPGMEPDTPIVPVMATTIISENIPVPVMKPNTPTVPAIVTTILSGMQVMLDQLTNDDTSAYGADMEDNDENTSSNL
jgi:hypothetical protein